MKRFFLLTLFLLLIPAGIVAGQSSSTNFVTQRFTIVGGDSAESSNFKTTGTIGQAVTDTADSSNFRVIGGFLFPKKSSTPTAINISNAATGSLAPFWLLLATAGLLLAAATHLYIRSRREAIAGAD